MNLPPYVRSFVDKTGKRRFYLRRKGHKAVALPDPRASKAKFVEAYARALKGLPKAVQAHEGSLDALIAEYMLSARYAALRPATRATYKHVLDFMRRRPSASEPVSSIRRGAVQRLYDEVAQSSVSKANLVVGVLSALFKYAVSRDYLQVNPATGIERLKGGEYRSWTDAEIEQFKERWPRGTTERLIFELALYTGQRRGDIAKMTWADVKDGLIYVAQEKTGKKLQIPCAPSLRAVLEHTGRMGVVLVATPSGLPFTAPHLGTFFARAIQEAGLPPGCVLHGLRKAASRRLVEAGCTPFQVAAITGHQSLKMIEHYTKDASQPLTAKTAMGKVVRMDRERSKK